MAENQENINAPVSVGKASQLAPAKKGYLTGFIVVCVIGFGIWWMFGCSREQAAASQSQTASARVVLPLESFTVNLADPEDGRFLRVTLSLGVEGQIPGSTKTEIKAPESGAVSIATIRDSIISVLSQCKSAELLTPAGKSKLKMDIIDSLSRDVPALEARDVYFVEFLVQR